MRKLIFVCHVPNFSPKLLDLFNKNFTFKSNFFLCIIGDMDVSIYCKTKTPFSEIRSLFAFLQIFEIDYSTIFRD
jgi:hypothetical protein